MADKDLDEESFLEVFDSEGLGFSEMKSEFGSSSSFLIKGSFSERLYSFGRFAYSSLVKPKRLRRLGILFRNIATRLLANVSKSEEELEPPRWSELDESS